MDKIYSFLEIQDAIKFVKNLKKGFVTNFFPEVDRVSNWIENKQFYKTTIGNSVFFIREEFGFSHLFFCSVSAEELTNSLLELKRITDDSLLVVDIIGKEPDVQSIVNVFSESGFQTYTKLNRMNRSTIKYDFENGLFTPQKAKTSQAKVIFDLLQFYFDPIAEQLPSLKEIEEWIGLEHLIIVSGNEKIIGFVIFDLIGLTSYLRYWFVHPEHRNKKIGSILLNEYFKNSTETKRQIFWVIGSNENAIKRYLHYGFQSENLYDYIMTNKNIQYETKDY
jgi:ribosomal protein S18 acetylase RimI-like enzyme